MWFVISNAKHMCTWVLRKCKSLHDSGPDIRLYYKTISTKDISCIRNFHNHVIIVTIARLLLMFLLLLLSRIVYDLRQQFLRQPCLTENWFMYCIIRITVFQIFKMHDLKAVVGSMGLNEINRFNTTFSVVIYRRWW